MKKIQLLCLCAALLQYAAMAWAGGPLYTNRDCTPVVFPASAMPIPYAVDQGELGDFSNSLAAGIVDDCFGVWQSVPTASISFKNAGFLPEDVNETNYEPYFDSDADRVSPVIFDSDGGIIDDVYGYGASDYIIGFSGSAIDYDASGGWYYTEGLTLINGRFTGLFTPAVFKATFVHEFGHFIGLDHSQINLPYVSDDNTTNDMYIPTMFPTSTDDDTPLGELNPDDEAALTMLYPAEGSDAAYGRIRGTLYWRSGLPARGANIVAVKQGDERMSQFSSVSDYCMQGDGSFEMLVTPGTYSFFVEPVYPLFTGGSSVGPYADTALSASFVFPVRAADYEETLTIAAGETKEIELFARRNWLRPVPGLAANLLQLLKNLGLISASGTEL
ncbi:MAG: hypothetical protein JW832_09970 [Deltaproteobacteria bacterium]|nr:hypothetical protein [Deltaproteobacteria bacterium]